MSDDSTDAGVALIQQIETDILAKIPFWNEATAEQEKATYRRIIRQKIIETIETALKEKAKGEPK